MRSFYFRPGKNAVLALFMGGLAIFFGKMWWDGGGFIMLGAAGLFAAAAAIGGLNAMNSEPVLKFDGDALWVRTTFGAAKEIPWREVHRISLEVLTLRYYGIIPMGRTETLCIACDGGAFGARRLRVSASAIQLPAGGAAKLVHILQQAHVEAVGAAGVAMAGAGSRGWGVAPAADRDEEPATSFDPDAAIARYLASKLAGDQSPAAPALGHPHMPQRPAFGRRVS